MRRFVVAVALGSALAVGVGTASAAVPARSPSRSRSYRVVLTSTGDEYEDASNTPINGTDGTKCPPSREVPSVKAKCWTWSAKGLGHGTFTQSNPTFEPGNFTAEFTYTDTHGSKLTGTNFSPGVLTGPDTTAHRRARQSVPGEHRHVHRRHREVPGRQRHADRRRANRRALGRPGHGHRAQARDEHGVRHAHAPPQALTGSEADSGRPLMVVPRTPNHPCELGRSPRNRAATVRPSQLQVSVPTYRVRTDPVRRSLRSIRPLRSSRRWPRVSGVDRRSQVP